VALTTALHAQDGDLGTYPPGTLTPNIDLGLQEVAVEVPAKYRDIVPEGLTVNLPTGFRARIFAAGLSGPRDMTVSPEGVLHVAQPWAGEIVALPDRDGDGVADEHIVVLDNMRVSDSVVFYKGAMYVGERHQVIRASDADGDGIYESREVLIADLPFEAWHSSKTIIFDESNDKLYVGVGSPCDLCRMEPGHQFDGGSTTETVPYRPERGTVLEFNPDGTGQRIFATGVRNVVGMDLHPLTNELWGTNNGHDLEGRSKPPEWIDVIRDGDFLGYPFVHSHQVWNDFTIERYHPMLPITREDTLLAMTRKRPAALVPAHWAPMRIHFYTGQQFPERYRNAAFVAFHAGRAKLSSHPGYKVQALFIDPDGSNAQMADFITGFQRGTTTSTIWGFPHGVTSDGQGNLYVSSDSRNQLILQITHSLLHGSWEHDLPESVVLASPVSVRATVRLERLAEDGGEPRVSADLSAVGGPADIALMGVSI
jgi:glucose/arabinose dehydrogenase